MRWRRCATARGTPDTAPGRRRPRDRRPDRRDRRGDRRRRTRWPDTGEDLLIAALGGGMRSRSRRVQAAHRWRDGRRLAQRAAERRPARPDDERACRTWCSRGTSWRGGCAMTGTDPAGRGGAGAAVADGRRDARHGDADAHAADRRAVLRACRGWCAIPPAELGKAGGADLSRVRRRRAGPRDDRADARSRCVHMVRNAVDHGIEGAGGTSARRASARPAGWPSRRGRRATRSSSRSPDDGRGIDVDRLVEKARAQQILTASQAAARMDRAQREGQAGPDLRTGPVEPSDDGDGDLGPRRRDGRGAREHRAAWRAQSSSAMPAGHAACGIAIHVAADAVDHVDDRRGRGRISGSRFRAPGRSTRSSRMRGESVRIDTLGGHGGRDGARTPEAAAGAALGEYAGPSSATSRIRPPTLAIVSTRGRRQLCAGGRARCWIPEDLVVKPAAPAVMATGVYAGQTLPDSAASRCCLLDGSGMAGVAGLRIRARRG